MKKDAIILLNMGGPNNIDEVEIFLKNMFDDPNILTMKSVLLRKIIAKLIIFSRLKTAKNIYNILGGKSPIVDITKRITHELQCVVNNTVVVDFAMRYTPPFANGVVKRLKQENISTIYLLPMYPHNSTTTTKSSIEDFYQALKDNNFYTKVIGIDEYYDNKLYNQAILQRIKEQMQGCKYQDYELIFSAHGLPQKIIDAGDKYQQHIEKNIEILKQMLKEKQMDFNKIHLAYQSKVGSMKWLEPTLEQKLNIIKTKNVIIYPIAFTVDNSETDYELSIEYKEIASKLNIKDYKVCRCVNEHPFFIKALKNMYENMKRSS